MLVLTRKVSERIRLKFGDVTIWVKVLDTKGSNGISIGIEAPRHVHVVREELIERDSK